MAEGYFLLLEGHALLLVVDQSFWIHIGYCQVHMDEYLSQLFGHYSYLYNFFNQIFKKLVTI